MHNFFLFIFAIGFVGFVLWFGEWVRQGIDEFFD